jgi:hypothetical protein
VNKSALGDFKLKDDFTVKRLAMRAIICAILAATAAIADVPKHVRKEAGYSYFGHYIPREAKSLDDLPEPARTRLVTHLKERLGERFYSTLQLAGGQIVDFAEFHRLDPGWKEKWVFAYNLHFRFRLPEKGIEYYTASIRLRSDGSVMQEIDLPSIAEHPDRGDFVSLSTAIQTATAAGFDVSHCGNIQIKYLPKYDRCVYSLEQLTRQKGVMLYYKCLEVDAHTGKQLRTFKSKVIQ